jgi:hypothetical protein
MLASFVERGSPKLWWPIPDAMVWAATDAGLDWAASWATGGAIDALTGAKTMNTISETIDMLLYAGAFVGLAMSVVAFVAVIIVLIAGDGI